MLPSKKSAHDNQSAASYSIRGGRFRQNGGGYVRTGSGGFKWHRNEARYITNKGYENNMHLPAVNVAMAQSPLEKGYVQLVTAKYVNSKGKPRFTYTPNLGKLIGKGEYGAVFRATYAGKTRELLRLIRRRSLMWADNKVPTEGDAVCIKVAANMHLRRHRKFAFEAAREASWHMFLSRARAIKLPGLRPSRAAVFVPRFYRMGLVWDDTLKKPVSVTVMSCAPGQPVEAQKGSLTADAYVLIEKAVVSMWLHGIVHADLHMDNVLYDPLTRKVTIIDFGFATMLSLPLVEAVHAKVVEGIAQGVRSLGEVWMPPASSKYGANVQAFVNRVQTQRMGTSQTAWYNPDGHALMALYGRVPVSERASIPELRRALWMEAARASVGKRIERKPTFLQWAKKSRS